MVAGGRPFCLAVLVSGLVLGCGGSVSPVVDLERQDGGVEDARAEDKDAEFSTEPRDAAVEPDGGNDEDAPGTPLLEICTPEGCAAPYRVQFGGSRVGHHESRDIRFRNIGTAPLLLQSIAVVGTTKSEFIIEPKGMIALMLHPGEALPAVVSHVARDGYADEGELQVVSSSPTHPDYVALRTNYSGTPVCAVRTSLDPNGADVQRVDFGSLSGSSGESRTLFVFNADPVVDGSALLVKRIELHSAGTILLELDVDGPLPQWLNQLHNSCQKDEECFGFYGETCDTARLHCLTKTGQTVDVLTIRLTLVGATQGPFEQSLQIVYVDPDGADVMKEIPIFGTVL